MEKFESQEKLPPTKEAVVEILRNQGIDNPEAKRTLIEYQEAQEKITDMLGGDFAHEEVALHMAQIYFDANYREYALECLDELQNETVISDELYERIDSIRETMLRQME